MSKYPKRPGYVRGSDTSKEAALMVEPSAESMRGKILEWITSRVHGATCDEAEVFTGWRHQTVSARTRELVLGGFIYDTGDRRATRSGASARVYKARVIVGAAA